MAGLLDIAPATEQVAGVAVYGVSARGLAHLLGKFPELRKAMSGVGVSMEDVAKAAPDAISAIIAAGVGKPGDEETEELADRLPLEVQAEFLEAIIRLTMPKGVNPFLQRLATLGIAFNGAPVADTQEPKSRKRSTTSSASEATP